MTRTAAGCTTAIPKAASTGKKPGRTTTWSLSSPMRTSGASETRLEELRQNLRVLGRSTVQTPLQKNPRPIRSSGSTPRRPRKWCVLPKPAGESFPVGKRARAFQKKFFLDASAADWNDWRWQMRTRIRTLAELERIFALSEDERDAVRAINGSLPVGITPYYAELHEPRRSRPSRCAAPTSWSATNICARPARTTIRSARTTTRSCPASSIAIPTACCSSPPASARPIAATARARAWSASPAASTISTYASGRRRSPTSRRTPRSATCCSRAAIR